MILEGVEIHSHCSALPLLSSGRLFSAGEVIRRGHLANDKFKHSQKVTADEQDLRAIGPLRIHRIADGIEDSKFYDLRMLLTCAKDFDTSHCLCDSVSGQVSRKRRKVSYDPRLRKSDKELFSRFRSRLIGRVAYEQTVLPVNDFDSGDLFGS